MFRKIRLYNFNLKALNYYKSKMLTYMFHKQSIMKYIVSEKKMRETRTVNHNKKTMFLKEFRQSIEKSK